MKAAEKSYKLKDEHFKNQAKKLLEKEEELKVEEARLEVLKKEVPDVTPGKRYGSYNSSATETIVGEVSISE